MRTRAKYPCGKPFLTTFLVVRILLCVIGAASREQRLLTQVRELQNEMDLVKMKFEQAIKVRVQPINQRTHIQRKLFLHLATSAHARP